MVYIVLFTIALTISIPIKIYLYPPKNRKGILRWLLELYVKERIALLVIDIFLVLIYIRIYEKNGLSFLLLSNMILTTILLIISIVDLKTKIIPNKLVFLGVILGAVTMVLNHELSIISSLLGLIISGGTIALISTITKGAIGMGDAKLFSCIGIFLGLQATLGIMLISTILSGLTGLIFLTFGIANRKTTLPFAPFISAATIFVMVL